MNIEDLKTAGMTLINLGPSSPSLVAIGQALMDAYHEIHQLQVHLESLRKENAHLREEMERVQTPEEVLEVFQSILTKGVTEDPEFRANVQKMFVALSTFKPSTKN